MKKIIFTLLLLLTSGIGVAYAGPCPITFPTTHADGTTAGTPVAGGRVYFFKDADISGFQCFEQLSSWFPSYITTENGSSPNRQTVDMAYTYNGTATFSNVVVPSKGVYTLTFRYAFATGLFPHVEHRPEGVIVNGNTVTEDLDFPVTGSFESFETVSLAVSLNAGANIIQLANQATQSVSRMDSMTVTASGTNGCTTLPGIPAGFNAAENSNNQIALNWTPSTVPASCHVGYYNLYRGTRAGFTPTEANEIATVVDINTYVDTTAVCGTPYFYFVEGLDLAGSSLSSVSAAASISQCPTTSSAQINAGGPAVAPYLADVDFTGGSASKNTATIDLTGVTDPAPAAVYGNARQGNFTYTLNGFAPNSTHTLRLHFVEPYFTSANARTFNISVNGSVVMTSYDIFSAAGGKKNKAVIYERTVTADETGAIAVQFTSVKDNSLVNAVEVK